MMVFLALLAHPDLQANLLAAYQAALELLEVRDYSVHQVMSMESFETNILKHKNVSIYFWSYLCKNVFSIYTFTTSLLPVLFHSSSLSLHFSHNPCSSKAPVGSCCVHQLFITQKNVLFSCFVSLFLSCAPSSSFLPSFLYSTIIICIHPLILPSLS